MLSQIVAGPVRITHAFNPAIARQDFRVPAVLNCANFRMFEVPNEEIQKVSNIIRTFEAYQFSLNRNYQLCEVLFYEVHEKKFQRIPNRMSL